MPERTPRRLRPLVFGILVLGSAALAAGYVTKAALDAREPAGTARPTTRISVPLGADGARVVFRSLERKQGRTYGRVALARFAGEGATRTLTGLTCDRLHMAAGRGICLTRRGRLFRYRAVIFGRDFRHVSDVNPTGSRPALASRPTDATEPQRRSSRGIPTRSQDRSRPRRC